MKFKGVGELFLMNLVQLVGSVGEKIKKIKSKSKLSKALQHLHPAQMEVPGQTKKKMLPLSSCLCNCFCTSQIFTTC